MIMLKEGFFKNISERRPCELGTKIENAKKIFAVSTWQLIIRLVQI